MLRISNPSKRIAVREVVTHISPSVACSMIIPQLRLDNRGRLSTPNAAELVAGPGDTALLVVQSECIGFQWSCEYERAISLDFLSLEGDM